MKHVETMEDAQAEFAQHLAQKHQLPYQAAFDVAVGRADAAIARLVDEKRASKNLDTAAALREVLADFPVLGRYWAPAAGRA